MVIDMCLTACTSCQKPHLGFHEPSLTLVMPPTPTPKTRTRKVEAMSTTTSTITTTIIAIATTAVMLLSRCHVTLVTPSLASSLFVRVFGSLYGFGGLCGGSSAGGGAG